MPPESFLDTEAWRQATQTLSKDTAEVFAPTAQRQDAVAPRPGLLPEEEGRGAGEGEGHGPAFEQRVDLAEQPLELHRFGVVVLAPGLETALAVAGHGVGGHGGNWWCF